MFDKYMVLTRGFQNVQEHGQITGFQLKVRITYYRGVFLPLVAGFDVRVDGETFKPEQMKFTVGDKTFTFEELGKAEKTHWDFGDTATLTIAKPGGLKIGAHEVDVTQVINPSYVPLGAFTGRTRRKITLAA